MGPKRRSKHPKTAPKTVPKTVPENPSKPRPLKIPPWDATVALPAPQEVDNKALENEVIKVYSSLTNNPAWHVPDQFFKSHKPAKLHVITQAICLDLGSFSRPETMVDAIGRLAVFEAIRTFINNNNWGKFERKDTFFQDPAFNAVDISFLQTLGYSVLDKNKAFTQTNSETFLFAPCAPGTSLKNIYLCVQKAHPALLIGRNMELKRHLEHEAKEINGVKQYWTLQDLKGNQKNIELTYRAISRPFYSSRAFQRLWEHNETVPLPVSPWEWLSTMWIYWTPEDKQLLKQFDMTDELDYCPCISCQNDDRRQKKDNSLKPPGPPEIPPLDQSGENPSDPIPTSNANLNTSTKNPEPLSRPEGKPDPRPFGAPSVDTFNLPPARGNSQQPGPTTSSQSVNPPNVSTSGATTVPSTFPTSVPAAIVPPSGNSTQLQPPIPPAVPLVPSAIIPPPGGTNQLLPPIPAAVPATIPITTIPPSGHSTLLTTTTYPTIPYFTTPFKTTSELAADLKRSEERLAESRANLAATLKPSSKVTSIPPLPQRPPQAPVPPNTTTKSLPSVSRNLPATTSRSNTGPIRLTPRRNTPNHSALLTPNAFLGLGSNNTISGRSWRNLKPRNKVPSPPLPSPPPSPPLQPTGGANNTSPKNPASNTNQVSPVVPKNVYKRSTKNVINSNVSNSSISYSLPPSKLRNRAAKSLPQTPTPPQSPSTSASSSAWCLNLLKIIWILVLIWLWYRFVIGAIEFLDKPDDDWD